MEDETQNVTPKLDSIELQNLDYCPIPESSLADLDSKDLSNDSLVSEPEGKTHEEDTPNLAADPDSKDLSSSLVSKSKDKTHEEDRPNLADPDSKDLSNDGYLVSEAREDNTPNSEEQEECCCEQSTHHQELKNQLRKLQHEIFKSLNQNLILKKRFLLAKYVVRRDMGVDIGCLEELVKEREEEGWCGSKGVALALKKKLHSLRDLVREKREERDAKLLGCPPVPPLECPLPEDERIRDLLSMEREYVIQNVRREEQKWVEDRDRMARKLEFFVEKNKKLEDEASSIRSDLCTEPEALEVVSVARFLEVQRKIDQSTEKKFKLKNTLLAAEASVRANEVEIERLKTEIHHQEELLEESETALKALTVEDGEYNDRLMEEFRIERQATSRIFRESLGELLGTYAALLERAESVEEDVHGRRCSESLESVLNSDEAESQLVTEIRKRRSSGKGDAGTPKRPGEAEEKNVVESSPPEGHPQREEGTEGSIESLQREEKFKKATHLESSVSSSILGPVEQAERKVEEEANHLESSHRLLQETEEKECRDAMKVNMIADFDGNELSTNTSTTSDPSQIHLVTCLEDELLELSATFAEKKRALRKRHWRLQTIFDRLKSEANRLLDARSQLSRELADVRVLSDKLKRIAKEASYGYDRGGLPVKAAAEDAKRDAFRFGDATEVEDSKALLQVLQSENACVKRLVRGACDSVDRDVAKFLQLSAIKVFF